jgi:hypothetical protein
MFSALQQGGKRLYDLARQGQVVERAARPVRVHDLELLRTRRDWQRAAVSKRHPCHLQHPQISHKDSTATTASALASAARAESPGWSEVLQLSPVICSAARAAGVRDETPPISPHAFPAQLRRRSETEGASVPGEDAAAAAVLGDDSGSGGDEDCIELPCFALDVECGGGTYVRSLISDIVSVGQTLRRPDRRVPADTASACLNCCLFVCVKKTSGAALFLDLPYIQGQAPDRGIGGAHGLARAHAPGPLWPRRLPTAVALDLRADLRAHYELHARCGRLEHCPWSPYVVALPLCEENVAVYRPHSTRPHPGERHSM